jgi:adenylate cyclase
VGDTSTAAVRLTAADLAALSGATDGRVAQLASVGILVPDADGTFAAGDAHRVRLIDAFERAGVPLEALVAGAASGRVDFGAYHELHGDPGRPLDRSYAAFRAAVDPSGERLTSLFAALGVAEPRPESRLPAADEQLLATWLETIEETGDPAIATRVVRQYGEASRRLASAALETYAEAAAKLGPDAVAVPTLEYQALLQRWTPMAQRLPDLAGWLTRQHLARAIDAFSVDSTELILADMGAVAARPETPPAVAFLDLTGFTTVTQALGDDAAAGMSLRLGELAREVLVRHDGRLVKLLGDGALLRLPDAVAAVDASLELLASLPAAGLPGGHVGVHAGAIVEREGDVFGRTVNLAARISDIAPDGTVYATAETAAALAVAAPGRFRIDPAASHPLQGIGPTDLVRISGVPSPA